MARLTMLITSLLLCLMAVSATPLPRDEDYNLIARRIISMIQSFKTASATLPASSLPAPSDGLTLKYVALGLGTQNYTCSSSDASATPTAVGAKANLFDATTLASQVGTNNKAMASGTCQANNKHTAGPLTQIGTHFFDSAGTPTFDLNTKGALLKAKKMNAVNAPDGACAGPAPDNAPAVPWLMLADDGSGRSQQLSQVFRVETAGGAAPANCAGMVAGPEGFTRSYAALYYLYGQ